MSTVEFKFDTKRVQRHFERFGREGAVHLKKSINLALAAFEDRFVRKRMGKKTKTSLGTRTGQLRRTLKREVTGRTFKNIKARIWFATPRNLKSLPWVHEKGMVITMRDKMLTVPLPAALTPAGVPKKRRAKDWKDTFIQATKAKGSKKGQAIIYLDRGPRRKPTALYVLARKVKIPGPATGQPSRLGFHEEFKKNKNAMLNVMLREWLKFVSAYNKRSA